MRNRSRNSVITKSFPAFMTQQTATTVNGAFGYRGCKPVIATKVSLGNISYLPTGILESISDEVPGFKAIGSVLHTKAERSEMSPVTVCTLMYFDARDSYDSSTKGRFPVDYQQSLLPYQALYNWVTQQGASDIYGNPLSSCPSPHPSRAGELAGRVMNAIDALHLANTLYEAREFPALFKMFTRRGHLLRHLQSFVSSIGRSKARGFKDLLALLRNGQLSWSFGISPTLSDMSSIAQELRNPKNTSRGRSVSIMTHSENTLNRENFTTSYGTRRLLQVSSRTSVQGCRISLKKTSYSNPSFADKTDELVAKYIGHNPLATIWEAIPFSFAIDWLISVDDVLDSFWLKNQNKFDLQYWSSSKLVVRRTCQSQYVSESKIDGGVPFASYPPMPIQYSDISYTERASSYSRGPTVPPSLLSSVRFRSGLKQAYLAALIASGLR